MHPAVQLRPDRQLFKDLEQAGPWANQSAALTNTPHGTTHERSSSRLLSQMRALQPVLFPYLAGTIVFITIAYIILLPPWHRSAAISSLSSPTLTAASTPPSDPKWLLAIFLGPSKAARRAILRSTWATRFPNPAYEYRFILGNYSNSAEAPSIDAENATFGDIWVIEDFMNENPETANSIKNMELFKYMVKYEGIRLRRYDFVSKVDDDNWLNIPPYFDAFIAPRLPGGVKYNPSHNLTMIGRPMNWGQDYVYASGRMYTISWPLLEFFAKKYTMNPLTGKTEDEVAGLYLYEDQVVHEYVPVELEQAWDIGIEYLVNNETILIHCIKDDETLLEVSTMFDDHGRWNGKRIHGLTNFDRNMKEVVERIGQPSEEELEHLRNERESPRHSRDPWESLDWKLIQQRTSVEDREVMGNMYPLNLPGNNVSTGISPRQLGWCTTHTYHAACQLKRVCMVTCRDVKALNWAWLPALDERWVAVLDILVNILDRLNRWTDPVGMERLPR
ncbi:MAG: hypothetical protein Q9163_002217 [Psora crenata]